jgi:hypothetical protein
MVSIEQVPLWAVCEEGLGHVVVDGVGHVDLLLCGTYGCFEQRPRSVPPRICPACREMLDYYDLVPETVAAAGSGPAA